LLYLNLECVLGDQALERMNQKMYFIFSLFACFQARDLEWYQEHRRKFLSKKEASNYSIYMSGLPVEYRSDGAVKQHFVEQNAHVFEARVALQIPNLEKHAMMRQSVVDKLEHAINVQYVKGVTPKHRTKMCGGKMVMSIPEYNKELVELNSKISSEIDNITYVHQTRDGEDPTLKEAEREPSVKDEDEVKASEHVDGKKQSVAAGFVSSIKSLVYSEDGSARNAAFISFSDLTSTNLALQACHHHKPWVCEVQPAPKPEQVEWKNVGTSNKSKQIGELLSLALTVILCLFWTIPVGFVASLSNVESLTELLPFLKPVVENNPWFGQLLAQLAPLILVGFISMLPYILLAFVGLEKSICLASLQSPSLFNKVAWFTIIQTFFVSTLSGSVTSELQKISENPSYAVELMAKALPSQASYFIQVILVQNFLGLGTELLRVSPVAQAVIRHYAAKMTGYDLTEKEMNTTIMGLRVFSDPLEYYFGSKLGGETILIFMVLFVYGTMSPITCYFTLLVFFILAMGFRNQFIYIYPIANDSGGTLFTCFIKTIIVCMIIAQVILIGVVGLKQSPIATALLIPLLISTFLFQWYLNKRHYAVTRCLPLEDCSKIDRENEREGMILDFLKEAYLQPAIKTKFAFPENHDKIIETGETNSRDPLSSVESTSP